MWNLSSLLVPVDFSSQSEAVLKYATALANSYHSQLDILNVVDYEKLAPDYPEYKGSKESLIKVIEKDSESKLNRLVKERDWGRLKVAGITITGNAVEKIIQVAKSRKSMVTLMATKGRDNISDFVIGSTTYKIIRTAPCPVLSVANPKDSFKAGKVLFTTDFSTQSLIAYEHAVSIAHQFNSQLHILHIKTPDTEPSTNSDFFENLKTAAFNEGVSNIKVNEREAKDITDGIIKYIAEQDIEFVVIATHGHGGFKEYFLGSTTVDVITKSKVPVLLVRKMEY